MDLFEQLHQLGHDLWLLGELGEGEPDMTGQTMISNVDVMQFFAAGLGQHCRQRNDRDAKVNSNQRLDGSEVLRLHENSRLDAYAPEEFIQ
jgi:hypothetical protein